MKSAFVTLALVFVAITLSYSQGTERLYRTDEGNVFTQAQLDSIANSGMPVGKVGEKVVNDTVFMMVQIYRDFDGLQTITAKYKGKPLQDFTLRTMDGREVTSEDLKGKVVMINFWSTTCAPCIVEMPELNRLQEEYQDRVVFLAPLPENKASAAKLLARHPFRFQIAPNSSALFEQLGIDGYPKNFFVNREGVIMDVTEGTPQQRDSPEGEWYLSVYEDYSAILDEILAGP